MKMFFPPLLLLLCSSSLAFPLKSKLLQDTFPYGAPAWETSSGEIEHASWYDHEENEDAPQAFNIFESSSDVENEENSRAAARNLLKNKLYSVDDFDNEEDSSSEEDSDELEERYPIILYNKILLNMKDLPPPVNKSIQDEEEEPSVQPEPEEMALNGDLETELETETSTPMYLEETTNELEHEGELRDEMEAESTTPIYFEVTTPEPEPEGEVTDEMEAESTTPIYFEVTTPEPEPEGEVTEEMEAESTTPIYFEVTTSEPEPEGEVTDEMEAESTTPIYFEVTTPKPDHDGEVEDEMEADSTTPEPDFDGNDEEFTDEILVHTENYMTLDDTEFDEGLTNEMELVTITHMLPEETTPELATESVMSVELEFNDQTTPAPMSDEFTEENETTTETSPDV